MTQEQKQEKKKPGLFKKILKWIGLSILTLLILLALFYEAPKKLVILLLIILAAFTALPKPARKWFWLSVSTVILILIVWIFLPEDNEGWRPYTFDEELAAMEAKHAIPDEENAATIYNELMENHTGKELQPDFLNRELDNMTLKEQWTSKEQPELAQWLQEQQDIMDRLLQAARKDKCQLKINIQPVVTDKLEVNRYPVLRGGGCLLIRAGNNDMAEGRIDQALEKYFCALRIANHLFQQQKMLDFMVGSSIEDLTLRQLNRFVIEGRPTAEQLQLISDSTRDLKNNWCSDLSKFLDFEKLYSKNMLCGIHYDINREGKVRFSRGTLARTTDQTRNGTYTRRKCAKLRTIFAWFYVPSSPEKIGKFVDAGFEKHYAMTSPDFDWNTQADQHKPRSMLNYGYMVEFMTSLTYPVYFQIHEKYQKHLTLRRGSRLLIAIKQYQIEHGVWPPDLDLIKSAAPAEAFIDPVTGNQLQYENHGERFSLYGETANIWPK